MHKQLSKGIWLNGAQWLSMLLVISTLATNISMMEQVHAASPYKVMFSTHNFGIQFLRATADDLSNPQHAMFSLTNGSALWYGIEVQSQPPELHPLIADSFNDIVSEELALHGLLPPSDIIPLNTNGTFFETVHLAAFFTGPGQQLQLTLNPFNFPATTFDVLNLILQLLGESTTNVQAGLLASGHVLDILNEVHAANDLVSLIGDFRNMLQAVRNNTAAVVGDANACVNDLLKLFANKNELEVLGLILARMVGPAIPGITLTLASFAAGLGTFLVTVKLVKFLADVALALGSYLFQQGTFPVVLLESVSAVGTTATQTSTLPPTPTLLATATSTPTSTFTPTPLATATATPTTTPPVTISELPLPTANSYPYSLTVGPDRLLWFTETLGNKIGRITSISTVTEFPIPTANSLPHGIITGADGNLWFGEDNANKIGRITPNGNITEFPIPTPSGGPVGITNGPDGNLWFTEYVGNKIGRITPSGTISEFPIPTAGCFPVDIVTGPDGNLWFTENFGNKIGRITPNGTITEFALPTVNNYPYGITNGPDGNLWFTERDGNKIGRITPNGTISEFPIATAKSAPEGITDGPDGNIWFTEQQGNKIGRITPNGTISEFPIATARSYPESIIVGPDNQLWFAEADGNKIGQITI